MKGEGEIGTRAPYKRRTYTAKKAEREREEKGGAPSVAPEGLPRALSLPLSRVANACCGKLPSYAEV